MRIGADRIRYIHQNLLNTSSRSSKKITLAKSYSPSNRGTRRLNSSSSTTSFSASAAAPTSSATTTAFTRLNQLGTQVQAMASSDTTSNIIKQPDHALLMIPGPIEFSDEVLTAMAHPSVSHVGLPFIKAFGETLGMLRNVLLTEDKGSQPFVVSGSGTLGWDMVAANLIERGEEVLVLHTGYFGDSFAECLETYGAKATQLKAPIGQTPSLDEISSALSAKTYKAITITHVDTSTGVLSNVARIAQTVKNVSPETLIVVDGVCSVGSEEIQFDSWGLDVVLTASQKALGAPPGLSVLMVSKRAMDVFNARRTPPASYFASFKKWTPIMQAYEAGKPMYFATPATNLVYALQSSLQQILSKPLSDRFEDHIKASDKVKAFIKSLGLKQLASAEQDQAHGMTAVYLPDGVALPALLPKIAQSQVVFAGGLHKEIATKYFRIGHMGVSATDASRSDLDTALDALKSALDQVK